MKRKSASQYLAWVVVALVAVAMTGTVWAIPAFARKHDMSCAQCHTAWPSLNDFGRQFKMNGYRVVSGTEGSDEMQKPGDNLLLERLPWLTGRIKGYLYDKKDTDNEWGLSPGHEVELMAAGNAGNDLSFWFEAEAEDETDYNLGLETVVAGWHPRETANVVAGSGPVFWADPYETLKDGGARMTRAHKLPLDTGFGSGEKLRKATPFITFYGTSNRFYYSATLSSGTTDKEGHDQKDAALRVAYDFPWITVGGFYLDATQQVGPSANLDFTRTGIDFQIERGNWVAYGLWMKAEDDFPTVLAKALPFSESNTAAYVEVFYRTTKGDEPQIVPLIRWETAESIDGTEKTTAWVAAVTDYLRPNINVSFEYWKQTQVPDGLQENDRQTLLFNFVF